MLDGRLFDRVPNVDMIRSVRYQRLFNPRRPFHSMATKNFNQYDACIRIPFSAMRWWLIGCRRAETVPSQGNLLEGGNSGASRLKESQALGQENPVAELRRFLSRNTSRVVKRKVRFGCRPQSRRLDYCMEGFAGKQNGLQFRPPALGGTLRGGP